MLIGCDSLNDQATRRQLSPFLEDAAERASVLAEGAQQTLDVDQLALVLPWYRIARSVDQQQHFHHWELIFSEILGPAIEGQVEPPHGFDLMFGNPPWMKVTWNDAPLLSEYDPLLGVRDAKSAQYNRERTALLADKTR